MEGHCARGILASNLLLQLLFTNIQFYIVQCRVLCLYVDRCRPAVHELSTVELFLIFCVLFCSEWCVARPRT